MSKYRIVTEEELQVLTEPTLRLFLSADLEGSTQLKQRTAASDGWMGSIALFSIHARQLFEAELQRLARENNGSPYQCPSIWKVLGDEVVFVHSVKHEREARILTEAFCSMVETWNYDISRNNKERGELRIKGTAWLAGFPVCNTLIASPDGRDDFAGPSIDTGFRIAKLATPDRFIFSVDLAWLLSRDATKFGRELYFSGTASHKGLNEKIGYPLIWTPVSKSPYAKQEIKVLEQTHPNPEDLEQLCRHFIEEHGVPSHLPFLVSSELLKTIPRDFADKLEIVRGWLRTEFYDVLAGDETGSNPNQVTRTILLDRITGLDASPTPTIEEITEEPFPPCK